jgi:hypothetical protein
MGHIVMVPSLLGAVWWWALVTIGWWRTGYRPSGVLTEEQRGMRSVEGFKRSSKGDFLVQYELF